MANSCQPQGRIIDALSRSLEDNSFVKLSLGKYRGDDPHLQKILIRLIHVNKGARLFFLYRYNTRDMVKPRLFAEGGVAIVNDLLGASFHSGHLFTLQQDFQIEFNKRSKARLSTGQTDVQSSALVCAQSQKEFPDRFTR